MEGKDDRFVLREERVEVAVAEPVRVLAVGLQSHQIHDIHHADLQFRQCATQDRYRGEGLQRRHIPRAGHHHVRLPAGVAARPRPPPDTAGAMLQRRIHGEPLRRRVLAGHHDVDVMAAAQTVVHDRQQAVGVRRQIDAHHLRLLVDDEIEKTRILVREAIVILAPDVRGQQVVQRGDPAPPRQLRADLEPLGMLVEHRIDDVNEGLVAVEEPVTAGEQITLEPALALVLAQHLEHPALVGQELIPLEHRGIPLPRGRLEHRSEPVRDRLIGCKDAKVSARGVQSDHVAQIPAEHACVLGLHGARLGHLDGVGPKVRQLEIVKQQAAVGVRIGAHAALARGRERAQLRPQPALRLEQLLRPVTAQPALELAQVRRIGAWVGQRNLMGSEGALDALSVDLLGSSPALGALEHDHRPRRARAAALDARGLVNLPDAPEHRVERIGHEPVHGPRLLAGDKLRCPPAALQQLSQLAAGDARQDGGIGDLVAVQMQNRQHHPVGGRVQEFVGMPGGRERSGFRFAITDHTGDDEVRVVERRAEGVTERVAEFSALMNGAGAFGRDVARNTAGEGELHEQLPEAGGVCGDPGIDLAVGSLEIRIAHQRRPAMTGAGDVDHVQAVGANDAVEMRVDEILARGGSPVAQQHALDVRGGQGLGEQRVVAQVDLAHREVIGSPPPRIDQAELTL